MNNTNDKNAQHKNTSSRTKGEESQISALKKYSSDLSEIEKMRLKLEQAGYGEKPVKKEKRDPNQILYNSSRKISRRREEDIPVFAISKPRFFKTFFNLITGKSSIHTSSKNQGKIKKGLIYFLKFKCPYILEDNTISYITNYVLKWQQKMRPLLSALYKAGWRTEDGRKILDPEEYNIISTCERISGNYKIIEIRRHKYNTVLIYEIANSFIYSYYQIIKSGREHMLKGFQNALYTFLAEHSKAKLPEKPEFYVNTMKEFFDGRIEDNFIVPLIEAVTGKEKSKKEVELESKTNSINSIDYKADQKLMILMSDRKEKYNTSKIKLQKSVSAEISFLETLQRDIELSINIQNKNIDLLNLSFLVMKNIIAKQSHIVREMFAAVKFFNDYYSTILTISFPARLQGRVEYIELFSKEVFFDEIKEIIKLLSKLKPLINDTEYADFLFNLTDSNQEKLENATKIGLICNLFFSIADKLVKVTTPTKSKKESTRPIDSAHINKVTIPYREYYILFQVSDAKKDDFYSLKGKLVGDVIENIRTFCFLFIKYFEPPYEITETVTRRRRTLNYRLSKIQKYKDFINSLSSDDDIKLPKSFEEI